MGFPFNQDSSDIGNMEEGSNEYPANVISSVMRRAHTNLVKVKETFVRLVTRRSRHRHEYVSLDEVQNHAPWSRSCAQYTRTDLMVVIMVILIVGCVALILFWFASLIDEIINNE